MGIKTKTNSYAEKFLRTEKQWGLFSGVANAWRYGHLTHNDTLCGLIPEQHKNSD